eukprot:gene11037-11192_t
MGNKHQFYDEDDFDDGYDDGYDEENDYDEALTGTRPIKPRPKQPQSRRRPQQQLQVPPAWLSVCVIRRPSGLMARHSGAKFPLAPAAPSSSSSSSGQAAFDFGGPSPDDRAKAAPPPACTARGKMLDDFPAAAP